MPKAKINTGRPVPIPYIKGKPTLDLLSIASGIRLPKNNAAEIGQKDRANIKPNINAPEAPDPASRPLLFSEMLRFGMLNLNMSNKNSPTIISTGPNALFMYFC